MEAGTEQRMGGWRTRSDDDLSAIMVVVLIICDSNKSMKCAEGGEETLCSSASEAGQDGARCL